MSALIDAAQVRAARALIKGAGAQLAGKIRGPDRRVRRDSIDVNDLEAQPWAKNRFETATLRFATIEALNETAKELYLEGLAKFPYSAVREAKARRSKLIADLERLTDMSPADVPVGRLAASRIELERLEDWLHEADQRLRRTDLDVFATIVGGLPSNGQLFPSHQHTAEAAGCHRNTAARCLARIKQHGFLNWKRRSRVKPASEGQFMPQREQTSHAYFFDHRASMKGRIWHRFLSRRAKKLKRMSKQPNPASGASPATALQIPLMAGVRELRDAVAGLGSSVASAST